MSLVSFMNDPFFTDFERMFEDAFERRTAPLGSQIAPRRGMVDVAPRVMRPRIDVHEDKDKNEVTAMFELPGMKKDDISIDIQNNILTVSGESKYESDKDEAGYVVRERRYGRFSRSVPVPEGVKPDQIKASMNNGVLTVMYPRQTAEQLPKRITIA